MFGLGTSKRKKKKSKKEKKKKKTKRVVPSTILCRIVVKLVSSREKWVTGGTCANP